MLWLLAMICCLLCAVEICSKEAGHALLFPRLLVYRRRVVSCIWHTAAGQDRTNTEGEDR